MYPFNSDPTGRPTASVFGSLGSAPDFDSRDAQFLLGWNTTNEIPAGRGVTNYLVRRARVTLTIASGGQYAYSGTLRDYRSYFPPEDPRYVPPIVAGDTVELFGVGYRGEYSPTAWGADPNGGFYTNRIAYAAGFDPHGVLVDVSNNVGDDGAQEIADPFEIAPFAVGQSTNVAPGELMPQGSRLIFELNLDDPLIERYLQRGLNDGNLRFMVTSLIAATFSGPPSYPNFYTIHSPLASPDQYPILDLEGAVVRPDIDTDADGLPDDWEDFYFGSRAETGSGDADADGASNLAEYQAGTKPNQSASGPFLRAVRHAGERAELIFPVILGLVRPQWSGNLENLEDWKDLEVPAGSSIVYSSAWLEKTAPGLIYPTPVHAISRDAAPDSAHRFYRLAIP